MVVAYSMTSLNPLKKPERHRRGGPPTPSAGVTIAAAAFVVRLASILDGEQDECGRYVATNGVAYRW